MIRLEQLRFGYNGGDDVLRLDEFVLEPESNILVVGPSGCGKTTLLHLIAGLLLPTGGSVVVDGQDLSALSPPARDRFRGRHIGIVLQQFHLLPTLDRAAEPAGCAKHRRAARGPRGCPRRCWTRWASMSASMPIPISSRSASNSGSPSPARW